MPPSLEQQYQKISKQVNELARKARNVAALEIQRSLKRGTPVDTGHLRSNWIPAIEKPYHLHEPGAGGIAQKAGEVSAATYKGPGPIYISNIVPYLQPLNLFGKHRGFVERYLYIGLRRAHMKIAALVAKRTGGVV